MKTIQLTKGFSTVVDDEDYGKASEHSWCVFKSGNRRNRYAQSRIGGKAIFLHQFLLGDVAAEIDHKDGDGLNNRRENLRPATRSQNGFNSRKAAGKTSLYTGVGWDSSTQNWKAYITVDGVNTHLGRYALETEAALRVDREAHATRGEWARLNFPRAIRGNRQTILFAGFGRAGKDAGAEFLGRITQLRYAGSFSWAALPFMADFLGVHPMIAWGTRHQNRQLWKCRLDELRRGDETLLAEMSLSTGEVAAGIRDKVELEAVKQKGLFDRIVWIDRPGTPVDPTVTFGPEDCHETIVNDGTLEQYHQKLFNWAVENNLPLRESSLRAIPNPAWVDAGNVPHCDIP